jgi:ABC-type phosphate transport system substrate-binding protein
MILTIKVLLPVLLLLTNAHVHQVSAKAATLMVHGSGTTNPEKCFGSIIEKFQARAKQPIRMTYRSVGSSTGLAEFVNNFEAPVVDFASGEIPLSSENWQKFSQQNVTVLHLPALFGAVSFFHSVPHVTNMNLTACLLARIFTRDIKDWSHPDILEENPKMDLKALQDTRIRVARRESGSGNTLAITEVSLLCTYDYVCVSLSTEIRRLFETHPPITVLRSYRNLLY